MNQSPRYVKKSIAPWCMAACVTLGLSACDEAPQTTTQTTQSLAHATLTPDWPPLTDGQPDLGLSASDTEISPFKKNIYLILDGSGSMADDDCAAGRTKMDVAKDAVAAFIESLPQDVGLGLAVFDSRGLSERVRIGSGNRDQLLDTVRAVIPNGRTPLSSSIQMAYDQLLSQGRLQLGYGEYHVVVITDGAASSGEDPRVIVSSINRSSPVVIHTIGFCIGTDHSLNKPGRTLYTAADDYNSLRRGLDSVLAESPDFQVMTFN